MTYEFEAKDGKRITEDFKVGHAPKHVVKSGKKYRRVFAAATVVPDHMKAPGSLPGSLK